ncbi:unnamed protein product, partial [Symbiodinium microadriaticum]
MVITEGGKEFQGRFERGVEPLGTLHHVTAPGSPWQNSRAERHGGWLKQRMIQELESRQSVIENLEDLDELLAATTAAKNRWFCSGGYTPVQLVFGEMPRVPGELLSDNPSSSDDRVIPLVRRVCGYAYEAVDCGGVHPNNFVPPSHPRCSADSWLLTLGAVDVAKEGLPKEETILLQLTNFLLESRSSVLCSLQGLSG